MFSDDWSNKILYRKELVNFDDYAFEGQLFVLKIDIYSPPKGYYCCH